MNDKEDELPYFLDVFREHDYDRYEYRVTEPDLSEEGWEEYAQWKRFDYTEERYWRRPLSSEQLDRRREYRTRQAARTEYARRTKEIVIAAIKAVDGFEEDEDPQGLYDRLETLASVVRDMQEAECPT